MYSLALLGDGEQTKTNRAVYAMVQKIASEEQLRKGHEILQSSPGIALQASLVGGNFKGGLSILVQMLEEIPNEGSVPQQFILDCLLTCRGLGVVPVIGVTDNRRSKREVTGYLIMSEPYWLPHKQDNFYIGGPYVQVIYKNTEEPVDTLETKIPEAEEKAQKPKWAITRLWKRPK